MMYLCVESRYNKMNSRQTERRNKRHDEGGHSSPYVDMKCNNTENDAKFFTQMQLYKWKVDSNMSNDQQRQSEHWCRLQKPLLNTTAKKITKLSQHFKVSFGGRRRVFNTVMSVNSDTFNCLIVKWIKQTEFMCSEFCFSFYCSDREMNQSFITFFILNDVSSHLSHPFSCTQIVFYESVLVKGK